jgi:hypothetical protein
MNQVQLRSQMRHWMQGLYNQGINAGPLVCHPLGLKPYGGCGGRTLPAVASIDKGRAVVTAELDSKGQRMPMWMPESNHKPSTLEALMSGSYALCQAINMGPINKKHIKQSKA